MKKTVFIIISIILTVAIIVATGLGITYAIFRSEGMHIWGDQISVNYHQICYLYDVNTQKIVGTSTMHWDAWLNKACEDPDPLSLEVEGYPPIGDVAYSASTYQIYRPDNILFYIQESTQRGPFVQGELQNFWPGRCFKLICELDTGRMGVQITNGDNDEMIIALPGYESEAEALAFLETSYGSQLLQ